MHAAAGEDVVESEDANSHETGASGYDTAAARDGENEESEGEEVEDELEEKRGLVDGKIRRTSESDEDFQGTSACPARDVLWLFSPPQLHHACCLVLQLLLHETQVFLLFVLFVAFGNFCWQRRDVFLFCHCSVLI